MKYNKIILLGIILLTIVAVGAVSASDNVTINEMEKNQISSSLSDDNIGLDESESDEILNVDDNEDNLSVTSFKNLETFEKDDFHGEISKECTPEFACNVYSSEMKDGNILIFFDDNLIFNETFDKFFNVDNEPDFSVCGVQIVNSNKLKSLDFKDYLVSVKYAENNNELLLYQTQVSVSYMFGFEAGVLDYDALGYNDEMERIDWDYKIFMDDDYQYAIWGNDFNFNVILPENPTGNLTVIYNGQTLNYANKIENDCYEFNIKSSDLKFGKNQLSAKYSGDDKYPEKTIYLDFETLPKFTIPDVELDDNKCIVSINVSKSATGNFNIYSTANEDLKLNKTNLIKSQKVSNGVSSIEVPLTDDVNYFYLEYKDDDYSWGSFYLVITDYYYSHDDSYNEYYSWGDYYDICSVEIKKSFTNSDLKNNLGLICFEYYDPMLSERGGNIVVLFNDTVYYNQSITWEYDEIGEDYLFNPKLIFYSDLNKNLTSGVYNVKVKFIDNTTEDLMHESYMKVVLDNVVNSDKVQKQTVVQKTSQIVKLTLKKIKVKKSAKKLVLSVTLKINGKVAKGKKITFKFNKKTYKAKTDKNGVAKVTIKKSVLKKLKVGKKIKYQASYGKTIVKKTVKVKK